MLHIENLTVHVQPGPYAISRAFIEALLRAPDLNENQKPDATAPSAEPAISAVPHIGDYWHGQGGIYAGVARGLDGAPDYHLILCTEARKKDFTWQAALDVAKTIVADGHNDFSVPTRFESALLYANLQDQFETDRWHWTSTQYSESYAWGQYFYHGGQSGSGKSSERRCRFVRSHQPAAHHAGRGNVCQRQQLYGPAAPGITQPL